MNNIEKISKIKRENLDERNYLKTLLENAYDNKMLNFIRVLYIKVKQNKLDVENEMYNGTILGGISGFLKIYNPDFKAQDMKITADYPLYNNLIGKLDGVEFIKEYIYSIYLENIFCNKFQADKVKHLLYEYSYNFEKLVINIFEIVFLETIVGHKSL